MIPDRSESSGLRWRGSRPGQRIEEQIRSICRHRERLPSQRARHLVIPNNEQILYDVQPFVMTISVSF